MKKKKKTKTKIFILVLLCLIILVIGTFIFLRLNLDVTDEFKEREYTSFTVDEGSYGKETLQKLEDEKIIKNSDLTYLYSKLFLNLDFKAGDYSIPGDLSLSGVINYLNDTKNIIEDTVDVTIIEGSFAKDFANEISKYTTVSYDDLMSCWTNEAFVRQLMPDYPFLTEDIFNDNIKVYLEGYLFPSTYQFYRTASAEDITKIILNKTLDIYNKYKNDFNNAPSFYHYDDDSYSKASIHDIFTLASILQWESGSSKEMDKVASVFYNRLNAPEVLASTVTACYSFDLSKEECAISGDNFEYTMEEDGYTYNTYTKQGLPIGPVASFSEEALYACLHPADTDYFYFVGDTCEGTGTIFASTWEQHQANIEKYVNCNID